MPDVFSFSVNDFTFLEQIGVGKFGIVYKALQHNQNAIVALKIIPKKKINSSQLHKQLQRQIEIHSRLKYKFICEMYAYFCDAHNIYLVIQYCSNGSLFIPIKILHQKFSQKKIASIIWSLGCAVGYLQERKVMHRDIKLQNILLDQNYNVKISDFGWCVHTNSKRNTFCGTMQYICPQMIKQQEYGPQIDTYCLGIILYELFYEKSPFLQPTESQTLKNIKEGAIIYDDSIRLVPQEAKKLISMLLDHNREQRPTAKQLLKHEFITNYLDKQQYQSIIL